MEIRPSRVNLDFEKKLSGKGQSTKPINDWDSIFFFLSSQRECLVTSQSFSSAFLSYLQTSWSLSPKLCSSREGAKDWWGDTEDLESEKVLNSKVQARRFSLWANRDQDFPCHIIKNIQELDEAFSCLKKFSSKVLLKGPFGFSGKGNFIFSSNGSSEKLHKVASSLFDQSPSLILEPWVKRRLDFRYRITERGVDQLGQTLIHPKGHFFGLTDLGTNKRLELESKLGDSLHHEMKNFFGSHFPFQADGFDYEDEKGQVKTRLISEFNHRHSLGEMLFRCRELSEVSEERCSWIVMKRTKNYDCFSQLMKDLKSSGLEREVFPTSDVSGPFLTFFVKTSDDGHLRSLKALYKHFGSDLPAWLLNQLSSS